MGGFWGSGSTSFNGRESEVERLKRQVDAASLEWQRRKSASGRQEVASSGSTTQVQPPGSSVAQATADWGNREKMIKQLHQLLHKFQARQDCSVKMLSLSDCVFFTLPRANGLGSVEVVLGGGFIYLCAGFKQAMDLIASGLKDGSSVTHVVCRPGWDIELTRLLNSVKSDDLKLPDSDA